MSFLHLAATDQGGSCSRHRPCALQLLAFAQSVLLGLKNGLEQIVEYCFFANQYVCRYHHARNNRQGFVMVDNGVFLGAHLYKIKVLAPLVFNGIGTD